MGNLSEDIQSTFPSERVKALINIKYTANYLDGIANEVLKPHNITIQQYNILRILRGAKKAIKVQSVKERMIEKSPNTTRLMDKLCAKKFISRERCEHDRRIVFVKITALGLDLLDSVDLNEYEKYMQKITIDEVKTLNYLLDKIR